MALDVIDEPATVVDLDIDEALANEISIGVELCNRGVVELDGPDFYRKRGSNRDVVDVLANWTTNQPGPYSARNSRL